MGKKEGSATLFEPSCEVALIEQRAGVQDRAHKSCMIF